MKEIVDSLDARTALLAVPLALLVAYGLLRLSTTLFTELREFLFAKVHAACDAQNRACRCFGICTRCRCAFISPARPAG